MADIVDREAQTEKEQKTTVKTCPKKSVDREAINSYCLKALIDNVKQIKYDTWYDVIP